MIPVRIVRHGTAPVRVAPVRQSAPVPKPRRAWLAGFTGRAGEAAELVGRRRRLFLAGMGPRDGPSDYEAAGALGIAKLLREPVVALDARGLRPTEACAFAAGAVGRAWRYDRLRTRPDPDGPRLAALELVVNDPDNAAPEWDRVCPGLEGAWLARDLVAEPSDTLTPSTFAARLGPLRDAGVRIETVEGNTLREAGLGALLAVGRASAHPPRLLVLRWPGAEVASQAPVLLVGKGITFDTGGVCIKPAQGMWEMRADMAGAAACAGAVLAAALRRSPAHVVAVLPLAENAVGAAAYRPGDVLRIADGTTVEVVDTDAEGRLVLADALAWAIPRLRPRAVVDVATLTGSIITALGHEMAGMFGDEAVCAHLAAAGAAVGERLWRMPIGERHREDLHSDIADLRHCVPGKRLPDACHGAAFLREFTANLPWAHLDIAGVESRAEACDRHAAGPTGFGARLLDRLLAQRFEDPHRG